MDGPLVPHENKYNYKRQNQNDKHISQIFENDQQI